MLDLRPLRTTSFRHLAAAGWANEFGNWVGEIALAILVYDRTGSALATASLFLAMKFAPAALAPLLTVRIETLRPRFSLAALYLAEAGLLACITVAARHFSLPLLLGLAACDGLLAITSTAISRSALATTLTDHGLLREGNALLNLGGMIVIAGAPAISGLVVAADGAVAALRIDIATFLIAALILLTARQLRLEADYAASFRERLGAGLRAVRARPTVTRLLVAIFLVVALGSIALPVEVVFAKRTLHAGDFGYGLLLTAWGVGMIAGGFAFATLDDVRLMPMLASSTALIAVGYAGMAVAPDLVVACAFSFVGGTGNSAAWVAARTALQERIPLSRQPAVMAVLEAANQVMPAVGFIVGGAVTAASSPRVAYAMSALGVAAVVAVFSLRPPGRIDLTVVDPVESENGPARRSGLQESDEKSRTSTMKARVTG